LSAALACVNIKLLLICLVTQYVVNYFLSSGGSEMKKIFLYFSIITLLGNALVFAMERFDVVTTQELKQMLDDRQLNKTNFILVNSLDEIIFRDSSILGSINLPWSRAKELVSILGEDKDKLIVTY
jgi:hypothetical protein